VKLPAFLRKRQIDREIDNELRFHIERRTADYLAAGMAPEAAAREARRSFGNFHSVREQCRDVRGASFGEAFVQDIRHGARGLANSPGFTTVAVLSLALGIGATTTVFSVSNAALWRPLPVRDAGSLFSVHERGPQGSRLHVVSYPDYLDYRANSGAFADVLAWTEADAGLRLDGRTEPAYGMVVSGNYFPMLGVTPALGRLLTVGDDRTPGAHPVAVIGFAHWQSRFGGDAAVVGKTLKLNGHTFTIVGVAPKEFTSTYSVFAPAFYVPLSMQAEVFADPERFESRLSRYLKVTGRLAPGVSRGQAEAALTVLDRRIDAAHPELHTEEDAAPAPAIVLAPVGSFPGDIGLALLGVAGLLFAIVGFVLLIGCANVAGMMLARATVRRHEMAVRLVLGATRRRLVRQMLTESGLLFCIAGAVGVVLAVLMTRGLATITLPADVPFALDAKIDARVLGFSLLLALVTGTLFGLAPALEAARAELGGVLRDAPAPRGVRRTRLRHAFVVGQIALTLVLLVGAGLAGRALRHAQTIYPGQKPESVWTASLGPGRLGYDGARARALYQQVAERVAALPGVESVSFVRHLDIGGGYSRTSVEVEGVELAPECGTVAPAYFRTLGITLLEGRDFAATDAADAPMVVIVNETFARHFWPNAGALGRRIGFGEGRSAEIVGVVENGRQRILGEKPLPFVYVAFSQSSNVDMTLVWRERGGAPAMAAVRSAVEALEPDLALGSPMSLVGAVRQATLPWRVAGALAGAFGVVGLALAVLGIFGLVSYTFRQRTQEIGLRVALGARRGDVFRLVMIQGLRLALTGIGIGAALAFGLSHALTALLFGIGAGDFATYASVAALLVVVTLLACWLPARRAARIDPMTALRLG
jgi:predicted permease